MTTALIILADGFEEIEAIACIDILRRGNIALTVAGLSALKVTSARNLRIEADTTLNEIQNQLFDIVILPGGEPGTTHLEKSEAVKHVLRTHYAAGKWIAAICAAPRILDGLGLLDGKSATSYPNTQPKMIHCQYVEKEVVVDGHIITSRGAGTAMEFAYQILTCLTQDKAKTDALRAAMVARN